MAAIERTPADTGTAWAATTTGRVFVTKNVDAAGVTVGPGTNPIRVATNVVWKRIDLPTTPNRVVSSIHVDSTNGNRAWVSYTGYSVNTPATPGHVFEVVFNPVTGTATWTNLGHDLADLPITDLVRDDTTGDLLRGLRLRRPQAGRRRDQLAARRSRHAERRGRGPDDRLGRSGSCTPPRTASAPGSSISTSWTTGTTTRTTTTMISRRR